MLKFQHKINICFKSQHSNNLFTQLLFHKNSVKKIQNDKKKINKKESIHNIQLYDPKNDNFVESNEEETKDIDLKKQENSSIKSYEYKNILDQDHSKIAFIQNFPKQFSEKQIYQYLNKEFQIHNTQFNITNIKLIKNSIGISTGKAVVSFEDGKQCQNFIERFDKLYLETKDNLQELTIRNFDLKTKKKKLEFKKNNRQVFIYNLPFKWSGSDVYELVESFGQIKNIQLPYNSAGTRNKGHAIVEFQFANQALEFQESQDQREIEGRKIYIQIKDFKFDTSIKNIYTKSDIVFQQGFDFKNQLMNQNIKLFNSFKKQKIILDL